MREVVATGGYTVVVGVGIIVVPPPIGTPLANTTFAVLMCFDPYTYTTKFLVSICCTNPFKHDVALAFGTIELKQLF